MRLGRLIERVRAVSTATAAAKPAIQQVAPCKDHKTVFKIKIYTFDKRLLNDSFGF